MNDFPRMLYRSGGTEEIHGALLSTLIVNDEDELDAALAKGWHLTTPEALGEYDAPPADDAPATRAEMLAKAKEMGLAHAFNISNVKLAELIDAALAKG